MPPAGRTLTGMQIPGPIPATPFTAPMAHALGVSRKRLDRLVQEREVRRVLQGVYVRADVEDSVDVRAAAARLVLSPFHVVCDRTAAWLLRIDTFDFRELEILPPLETFALRTHSRTRRRGCASGTRDLLPRDVCDVNGVPTTTPLRTAIDLACKLSRRDALAALDAFMASYALTTQELRRELVRYFRRRGVVQARELVPLAHPDAESPGESWTRMEMIDHRLPPPSLQHWVTWRGVKLFRLDLSYPKHKIAVEYDGREFHDDEERREHDRQRRKWLRDHGWTVVVVTKDDFTPEAVDRWVNEIRDALRLAR